MTGQLLAKTKSPFFKELIQQANGGKLLIHNVLLLFQILNRNYMTLPHVLLVFCYLIYSGRNVVIMQIVPRERGNGSSKQLCKISSSSAFDPLHYIFPFLEENS